MRTSVTNSNFIPQHDRIGSTNAMVSFRTCEMVRYMKRGNQRKVKYVASVKPPLLGDEEELRTFFHTPTYEHGRGLGLEVKEAPDLDDANVFLLKYDGMKGRADADADGLSLGEEEMPNCSQNLTSSHWVPIPIEF